MQLLKDIRASFLIALWFIVLTFPLMVIRVNTVTDTIEWRWERIILVGVGSLVGSFIWRYVQRRQRTRTKPKPKVASPSLEDPVTQSPSRALDRILARFNLNRDFLRQKKIAGPFLGIVLVVAVIYPFLTSMYQTNIMISALIYVILALGLNIVIGLGGMLHLGYAAFYAVGAYTYGILNHFFGVGFWVALPIAGVVSGLFGILLGVPVLRLRGDYLAIVTLAFVEIVRIVLTNFEALSLGPSGIKGIDRPALFGIDFALPDTIRYIYFICLVCVIVAIIVINRLENSRIGRQWVAMGEDDIASRAMGVNTTKAKLTAFALSAVFAGVAGVLFAAKTTFINPESFRVWESVLVLSMVVLGGMGSIPGVILGAMILILLPEYLRAFSQYRLLIFGAVLVLMMVFKPDGLIPKRRKAYRVSKQPDAAQNADQPAAKDDA